MRADQRVEDKPGVFLDAGNGLRNLIAVAHHIPDMLDRFKILELSECCRGNHLDGLAGRIGNQMKVESHNY